MTIVPPRLLIAFSVVLALGTIAGSSAGPDLDRLGADYRRDGIHFNDRGLDAAADLWLEALRGPLDQRQKSPRTP